MNTTKEFPRNATIYFTMDGGNCGVQRVLMEEIYSMFVGTFPNYSIGTNGFWGELQIWRGLAIGLLVVRDHTPS